MAMGQRAVPQRRQFARIVDVAREAAVSTATVSRVLNGDPAVSGELRRSVLDAAARLNYVRDPLARALRTGATQSIAVGVRTLRSLSVTEFVSALGRVLDPHRYVLMVTETLMRADIEAASVGALQARHFDAIVTLNPHSTRPYRRLAESGQKVLVVFGPVPERAYPFQTLSIETEPAIGALIRYLDGLGHRHLRVITLNEGPSERLLAPYHATPEVASGAMTVSVCSGVEPAHRPLDHGEAAALDIRAFLEGGPTCLLIRPEVAATVLDGLRAHGLRIPDDLSVVIWGSLVWSNLHSPPLDALETDLAEVGAAAGETLLEMLRDEPVTPRGPFMYRYVRRGSTGPPGRLSAIAAALGDGPAGGLSGTERQARSVNEER